MRQIPHAPSDDKMYLASVLFPVLPQPLAQPAPATAAEGVPQTPGGTGKEKERSATSAVDPGSQATATATEGVCVQCGFAVAASDRFCNECGAPSTPTIADTGADTAADGADPSDQHPDLFVCPISLELMTDPVLTADGHTYQRESIETWLTQHQTSPLTGLPLPHRNLVSNFALKAMIAQHRATISANN